MLAFSNDYYGFIFRVTQSVELFCTYDEKDIKNLQKTLDLLDEDDDVTDVWHNWDE